MKLSTDIQKVFNPDSCAHRRDGLNCKLTNDEIEQFHELGYLVLNGANGHNIREFCA
jgi:hypothetical protein